jgi:hypothetical protein
VCSFSISIGSIFNVPHAVLRLDVQICLGSIIVHREGRPAANHGVWISHGSEAIDLSRTVLATDGSLSIMLWSTSAGTRTKYSEYDKVVTKITTDLL